MIEGPAVIGDGCKLGDGAFVRDAVLLGQTEVPAAAMLVGGVAGRVAES